MIGKKPTISIRIILLCGYISMMFAPKSWAREELPKIKHLYEFLNESSALVIGRIASCDIVTVKQGDEFQIPDQTEENKYYASWWRDELYNFSHIVAYQIDLEITERILGDLEKDDVIKVNIGYAQNEKLLTGPVGIYHLPVNKSRSSPGSRVLLCLRIFRESSDENTSNIYELVTETYPQAIQEEKMEKIVREYQIIALRYDALLKIDKMIENYKDLTSNEIEDLKELIVSSKTDMGKAYYYPDEEKALNKLLSSGNKRSAESTEKAWKDWWMREKDIFIDRAFMNR